MSRYRARPELLIGLAVIVLLILGSQLLPSINAQKVLHDIAHTLGAFTYPLAWLAAFLETGAFVGLVLPGETFVILAGAVAGQGATSIWITVAVVWLGAFLGDSTSFWIGRRLGRGFALRHGRHLRITEERLQRVEAYFERYGGRTIVIGRFIGLVRALAPFVAGTSGWRYRDCAPYCVVGTGLWAAAFCLVGYFASKHLNDAVRIAGHVTLGLGVAAAVGVAIFLAVAYLRRASEERRSDALFIGLAATSAIGVAAVAVGGVYFGAHPGPTALDTSAFDAARSLYATSLVDVAKVVTYLGSGWVTVPLAVVAGVVLARRRLWMDLVVLAVGVALTHLAVLELKALVDRPRPPHPLVATHGASYPSGHAAEAILYPFLAFLAVARMRLASRPAIIVLAAGVVIAIVVGLTRVYLRAHYLTDVLGGWALGVAAFAGVAAIALLVGRFRQNQGDGAPTS